MNKVEYLQTVLNEEAFELIECFLDTEFNEDEFNDKFHDVIALAVMLYNENVIRFDFMSESGPWTPESNEVIQPHVELQKCICAIHYYNSKALRFGMHTTCPNCLEKNTNLDHIELNISKMLYILHNSKYSDIINIEIDCFKIHNKMCKVESFYRDSIDAGCLYDTTLNKNI